MEPLSIAAGTLTLLGALGATAKGLKKLASLKHAPIQILQLCNEVKFAATVVKDLQHLLEEHLMQDIPSTGLDSVSDIEFSKRAWLKHQTKSLRLFEEIRDYRVEINNNLNLLCA
ncbi:hypothetical protein MMC31_006864 [Peltigera leucophlebia]|nr:hypothetical protein [Peltigera leucophlebia]